MLLAVLQRLDPHINNVLFTSTFCSIFENDEATSQWHSLNYEGSLYVVYRKGANDNEGSFKIVLLNRKKKDDYIEDIRDDTEFKCKD